MAESRGLSPLPPQRPPVPLGEDGAPEGRAAWG